MTSRFIAAAALAVALSTGAALGAPPALPETPPHVIGVSAAPDMTGLWVGTYGYADGRKVSFVFAGGSQGSTFSGAIIERNTMSDTDLFLSANVNGSVIGDVVSFTKTYDGTGGQTHSVNYAGRIDRAGKTVRGDWTLADGTTGTFELKMLP